MKRFIQSLSPGAEFVFVIVMGFGYLMLSSVSALFDQNPQTHIAAADLISLVVYESFVLYVVAMFLRLRYWQVQDLVSPPSLLLTGIGLLLWISAAVLATTALGLASLVFPELNDATAPVMEGDVGLPLIFVAAAVNALFEEVMVTAYVITRLSAPYGFWFAVNASVLIRLSYQLAQGSIAIVTIIPIGMLFAVVFARTNRLWPILVAHFLFDFIGLYSMSHSA